MKKSVVCFLSPRELIACIFALFYFTSIGYASPQPSTENNVHFCLPLNLEDMQARDSIYAATKHALNLNVGEPRTVRMIYFLPNDRPFRQGVVDSMKIAIRQIQTFYAEQMQAHGYGNKTFRFETDARGEPMVHRVDGQYPDSHYLDNTSRIVLDEVEQVFDRDANIYLLVIDNSINAIGSRGQRVGGIGGNKGKNGGFGLVHGGFSFHTAAHELGHAFGLQHDFNDNAYIMSYSSGQRYSISACNAEFLVVHPYFNLSVEAQEAPPPTIEITSPLGYPAGSRSVSIQLKVSDTDDLHQVILFVSTRKPHLAAGSLEVKACRGLNSAKESVVEFDYNGVIPSDGFTRLWNPDVHPISIWAVDTQGNVRTETFSLWEISPHRIATLEHSPYSSAGLIPTVESVAYSPDGTMLASGSGDGTVKLWDVAKKENIATFEGHTDRVSSVTFSPDGTTLVSGAGDGIKLWDVSTRRDIATLEGGVSSSSVAFSPDGTTLASGAGRIKLWDVATRRDIATLEGHTGTVHSVAFSSDGTTLASGSSDETVKLWDVTTKENIATLEGHKSWVSSVTFSPDGTALVSGAGEDKTVKLWDVAKKENIATFEGHTGTVHSVVYSPDGTMLASGAGDGTIKLWDIATGQNIATYKHIDKHSGRAPFVYSVAFSPDGTTLASGAGAWYSGGTIILWDVSEWIRPRPQTLVKISGDNQQSTPSMELANPFVVEVKDQHDNPLSDVQITFTVIKGDGKLRERFTVENTMTDVNGRAQSILTLGPNPGTNTVEVTISGFSVTFNAAGVGTPTIMGGDYRKWHLPDGAIIRLGKGHLGESDRAVAFSPDGQSLAVAGGIGVWLYDAATLRELALFTGHTGSITSVAFSPEGTMLASGSSDKTIKLWDIATGRTIATLEGHTGWVNSVAFSLNGTTLASGSGQQVKLWDVATQTNIATLMHTHSVTSVAFSPDGTMLASGTWGGNSSADAGTAWLWDVSTRRHIATLEGHTGGVTSVAFSPNVSTLASGAHDGVIKLWDIATQTNVVTLEGHTGVVYSVAFSSDGTTLASGAADYTTGSYDGKIKLWDMATQTNVATLEGHTDIIRSVAFSPDGTTLVSGGGDGVRVWDVLTQNISILEGHSRNVFFSSFSPDGKMLAGGVDGMFKLWDVNTGHPVVAFERHMDEIGSVAFSPDGITLASTSNNTIKLWDISTGRTIATLEGHTEHIHSVVFSPDGTTLASWGDQGVEIWDVAMGGTIATLKGDTSWISSMMFSPDGVLLAAGPDDRMVKLWLWGISTGRNIVTLEGHSGQVLSVAFSPDGTILASREQNEVKLWDVVTGRTITTLEWSPWYQVYSMVFSPDGTMLASGDNSGWIELWEVSTGRNIATLEGHTSAVDFVAFSPDGTSLASGGYFNDKIKLWDVMTGRTIATLEHFEVNSIMFSPDGMRLASKSGDGTVLLWDMSLYITPQAPNPDFNGDGRVDLSDFLLFASQFGLSRGDEQYDTKYDLDGDGTIGFGDFLIFGRSFGKEGS